MSYLEVLGELEEMIKKAKSVPLSASAVIPREETLAQLAKLREAMPAEHEHAKEVLADKEGVISDAREEAMKILEEARAERGRLISQQEVVQSAQAEAEKIGADADALSAKMRSQADDYADQQLARMEIILNKILRTIGRGRDQLRTRLEAAADELPPLNLDDSGEISGELPLP